jgi:acyl-CoA thioester hydrolase
MYDSPWSTLIHLRFDDVNAAGHVGITAITRLVEHARSAFLGRVDRGGTKHEGGILEGVADGVTRLVARQTIEFRNELQYSSVPVKAQMWVSHIGRTSFSLACTLGGNQDEDPAVLVESTIVLIDRATAKGWPIDEALHSALSDRAGKPLPLRP